MTRPRRIVLGLAVIATAVVAGAWLIGDTPRAPASVAGYAVRLDLVVGGLQSPVDVVAAPGEPDALYVAEQVGTVRVVRNGRLVKRPFLDLTDKVLASGEQGLLGLAFHPEYERNGRVYVHYSDLEGDTRVVEYTHGVPRELLAVDQPYENHKGGQIAFGPDGRLYVGLGDGGSAFDPERRSQDPGSLLGKLLALDVDTGGAPEIVAYGLRNPWRFAFDEHGNVFIGDVGQDKWEEVNVLPAGERNVNFGWDVYEGRDRLNDLEPSGDGRLAGPIAAYPHGDECSITGGRVYRGDAIPELRGRFLYGDFCSGRIWSLAWDGGEGADVRPEGIALPALTAFGEGPDRELYLGSQAGALYRLTFVP